MLHFLDSPELWVFLAFVSFVGLMGKRIWASLLVILDKRTAHIKETIRQAEALRHDAEVFLIEQRRLFDDAERQAQQIIEYAQSEAENIKKEAKLKALHFMENQERILEQKISRLEIQLTEELKQRIIDETVSNAESLLVSKHKETEQSQISISKALRMLEQMNIKDIAS